eukprot:TRINITY_DN6501_c0_g1_i3.p1 TRINITY_DN6501_c0_g1~~TRINITY_DN6501_c0_g1_i3.p1  ORF type:complete len:148 (-),score=17.73 TRINITY_DN6501_c0_g1_i3:685-1128(-)
MITRATALRVGQALLRTQRLITRNVSVRLISSSTAPEDAQMPPVVDKLAGLPPSKSYYPSYSPDHLSALDDEEDIEDSLKHFDVWPCGRDQVMKRMEGPEPNYDKVNSGFNVFTCESPFSLQVRNSLALCMLLLLMIVLSRSVLIVQ